MAATKLAEDVIYYWHYMQNYYNAVSFVGRQYILDVEMRQFLTKATNPRVIRLLTEFIESKTGVIIDG